MTWDDPKLWTPRGDGEPPLALGPMQLPEGVSQADWALERVSAQNPRIRVLLGCARRLEEMRDSNFAILHCSPERLYRIRTVLHEVSGIVREELDPLVQKPSQIPDLEKALEEIRLALRSDIRQALAQIDSFRELAPAGREVEIRKIMAATMGRLHTFFQDALGLLIEADPRSGFDADYFLSRRFPQDIEEAEQLYSTVDRLNGYLKVLGHAGIGTLLSAAEKIRRESTVLGESEWDEISVLVNSLMNELQPLLKEILALRGIRFEEMEMLDRQSYEIPAKCVLLSQLHAVERDLTEVLLHPAGGSQPGSGAADSLTAAHEVLGRRMALVLEELHTTLEDLAQFIPAWLRNIGMRRALMLRKVPKAER